MEKYLTHAASATPKEQQNARPFHMMEGPGIFRFTNNEGQ